MGRCAATEPTAAPIDESEADVQQADLVRALIEQHNRRIDALQTLSAGGVIEIIWYDENGKQFAQGDADFWFQQPLMTALRVEKLGDVLLWLGSDGPSYWLFDLLQDHTVLTVGRPGEAVRMADGSVMGFDPAGLLDLIGLSRLPESSTVYAGERPSEIVGDAIGLEVRGSHQVRRMYLDASTAQPVRVELYDEAGELVAHSRLQRYHTVPISGRAALDSPKIPTLIDLFETQRAGSVKLAFGAGRLSGDRDSGPFDRVFSLDRLKQAMPPDLINDLTAP